MDDGEPVESYLDRFPVRCQHFLGKLHHFQGHVCNRLGVTINLLVKSSCHTVGISNCLDLCEKCRRRGKNVNAVTLNSVFVNSVNCERRGKKNRLIAREKKHKEKSKARRQTAIFWPATGKNSNHDNGSIWVPPSPHHVLLCSASSVKCTCSSAAVRKIPLTSTQSPSLPLLSLLLPFFLDI